MKRIEIGILGLGIVGSGVYRLIDRNRELISKKSGVDMHVRKVADLKAELKGTLGIPDGVFTHSAREVLNDPAVDLVVELIGGTTTAKDLMLEAIRKRKHVVTANKALLAKHGKEIFSEVLENRVEIGFEGSVGGGIPIIKTVREALVGNRITKIVGILNGTTNFVLTKMTKEGIDFERALKAAQKRGFAEADPTLDVSGEDARHKITILSSLGFNTQIDMSQVHVEGIEKIDKKDIQYAGEFGFVLKLLATGERFDGGVLVKVHPALVSKENPLAAISWEDNAIVLYSDFLGKSMYSGKGAGSNPTASAVVADIAEIALRVKNKMEYNRNAYTFFQDLAQLPFEESKSRYYFRFHVLDRPGILSRISGILGECNISIASVIQKESEEEREHVPLVMLSHTALEADVRMAIARIDLLSELEGPSRIIRVVEDLP
jgi:homoserine dehydrogenase